MLKPVLAVTLALALPLALPLPAQADSLKLITDEKTFRSVVVGKKLSGEGGTFTIKSNGTLTGRFDKQRLRGNWVWQKGLFCRKTKLGKNDARSACQKVEVSSSGVRLTTTKRRRVSNYSF